MALMLSGHFVNVFAGIVVTAIVQCIVPLMTKLNKTHFHFVPCSLYFYLKIYYKILDDEVGWKERTKNENRTNERTPPFMLQICIIIIISLLGFNFNPIKKEL